MKHLKYLSIVIVLILVASCQNMDNFILHLAEDDAALIVENSLAKRKGGLLKYLDQSLVIYQSKNGQCNLNGDTLIQSSMIYQEITYVDSSSITYQIQCDSTIDHNLFETNITAFSQVETSNSLGSHNVYAQQLFSFSNNNNDDYMVEGDFSNSGQIGIKDIDGSDYIYNISFVLSELAIDPNTKTVEYGTATFNLGGYSKSFTGQSFHFVGRVAFKMDQKAILTMRDKSYELDLQ